SGEVVDMGRRLTGMSVKHLLIVIAAALLTSALAYSQSLNFDAMCKAQAEKEFRKNWNEKGASYQNHYNTKLKKCLMLIETLGQVGDQPSISKTLLDAYEGRVYATFYFV